MTLLRSFVGQFAGRRYTFELSKFSASLALSVGMLLNVASLIALLGASVRREMLGQIPDGISVWLSILMAIAGLNWWLTRSIRPIDVGLTSDETDEQEPFPGQRVWRWYSGITLVVFFVATAMGHY